MPGLRRRHQGRRDRAWRRPATRRTRRSSSASTSLGWTFEPSGHPVEFLSLSGKLGAQVRATVHSFGPLLLGKVLDLNDTQTSILSLVFKYCDDNDLPLLDLKDLATTLKFLVVGRRQADPRRLRRDVAGVGRASSCARSSSSSRRAPTSSSASPSSTSRTCSGRRPTGEGIVSVLELSRRHGQAARCSRTFMLWMLAQLYETLPEVGDLPKPKLCFFFDEAHLLFDDASQALLDQIERTARLIRSKGVGVYFVTQAPTDVPSSVLAQLGNRVQHALRAFTPGRRRRAAQDRPDLPDDDVLRRREDDHLARDRRGARHRPVAAGRPDAARGDPPAAARFADGRRSTPIRSRPGSRPARSQAKYGQTVDRESAYEMITARIAAAKAAAAEAAAEAAIAGRRADPTTATGLNTMTPAQQQREIKRQAKEMAAAQRAAEQASASRAARRPAPTPRGARSDGRDRRPDRRPGRDLAGRPGPDPRRVRDAVRQALTRRDGRVPAGRTCPDPASWSPGRPPPAPGPAHSVTQGLFGPVRSGVPGRWLRGRA